MNGLMNLLIFISAATLFSCGTARNTSTTPDTSVSASIEEKVIAAARERGTPEKGSFGFGDKQELFYGGKVLDATSRKGVGDFEIYIFSYDEAADELVLESFAMSDDSGFFNATPGVVANQTYYLAALADVDSGYEDVYLELPPQEPGGEDIIIEVKRK